MPSADSSDRLHQSTATTTVGIIVVGRVWLNEGVNPECGSTEHAADQFERETSGAQFDEFTHDDHHNMVPM